MTGDINDIWHAPELAEGKMPPDDKISAVVNYLATLFGFPESDEDAMTVSRMAVIDVYESELARHPKEPHRINSPIMADFISQLQIQYFDTAALRAKANELIGLVDKVIEERLALITLRGGLFLGYPGSGKATLHVRTAAEHFINDKETSLLYIGAKDNCETLRHLLPEESVLDSDLAVEEAVAMRGAQIIGFGDSERERLRALDSLWRVLNFAWSDKQRRKLILALDSPHHFIPEIGSNLLLHTLVYAMTKSRTLTALIASEDLSGIATFFGDYGLRTLLRFEELAICRCPDERLDALMQFHAGKKASDLEPGKALIIRHRVEHIEPIMPPEFAGPDLRASAV